MMKLNMNNLQSIAVLSDGRNMSIDKAEFTDEEFTVRNTAYCSSCESHLHIHEDTPFASCECGTTEWYF